MKKEIADRWVAALRSGDYEQDQGRLKTENGFCCLGVLCDVYDSSKWNKSKYTFSDTDKYQSGFLPEGILKWSGIRTRAAELPGLGNLVYLNDGGDSFLAIADIIENRYKDL